jgi:1,4-alpha-glucan branching enzyme
MAKKAAQPATKKPAKKRISFALEAPDAKSVIVTGTFCDWAEDLHPLKKDRKGVWKGTVYLMPGRHEYRFLVDGQWQDDPNCAERVSNSFGSSNCVIQV